MKFVKFSPSHLAPDQMTKQSTTTETGLTTYALIFPSAPVTAAQLAAQRLIVATKVTAQKNAALAFANASKELATENTLLGSMLLQDATYIDGIAQVTPADGRSLANKGGYASVHDAVHHTADPDEPTGLSVTLGDMSGSADLHWDKMKFTDLYKVYYSLDATAVSPKWTLADSTAKSSITLHALPISVPIMFMVEGHNSNGDSGPSAIVTKTLV